MNFKSLFVGSVIGLSWISSAQAQQLGTIGGGNDSRGDIREEGDGDLTPPDGGGGVAPGNGSSRFTQFSVTQDKSITRTESR